MGQGGDGRGRRARGGASWPFRESIGDLVFWPVYKPPSSLKWTFRPFARPHPSPQKANLGFWKGGRERGGAHQNSDFQPKPSPSTPYSNLAFWPFWESGKIQKSNLYFAFLACLQARSLQKANLGFGRGRGGVHPSKLAFWPLGGLGQGWQNPKIKFENLVFWPVSKPHSYLKWAFWPFARPRQRGGGGGGGTKIQS